MNYSVKKPRPLPELSYLKERLLYEPNTGEVRWMTRPVEHFKDTAHMTREQNCDKWNARHANKVAGTTTKLGYRQISLDGVLYLGHRLAFFMGNGLEPRLIDHLNGDRSDNRLCNLACVVQADNNKNSSIRSDNTTGIAGVRFTPHISKRSPWRVDGYIGGKLTYVGAYSTLLEAAASRKSWMNRNGYSFRHGTDQPTNTERG